MSDMSDAFASELAVKLSEAEIEVERLCKENAEMLALLKEVQLAAKEGTVILLQQKAEIERLCALRRIDKYEPAPNDPHPEWTHQRQRDVLIEEQAAEIERLTAALRKIAEGNAYASDEAMECMDIARAALAGRKE